jgi:ACS family tartrate transporter-like MFS transporter
MIQAPALSVEQSARRRIARRLLPFLWLLYMIAFLDRVNVAYAALEMSHDLKFSDRVFGFGAGIFFIGYVLLEIPGALIVERWSARRWIARIMISWGIVTILVGFVHTAKQFYLARFLLGAAEAGFFPGIIVYLTHWFCRHDRTKAIAVFMAAIPLSSIVGSPIAGKILSIHWYGLEGWRWLFILEGIPAVLFGIVTLLYLTDWPREATWLPSDECKWIESELEREKKSRASTLTVWQAFRQRNVILLTLIYFLAVSGLYGFTVWLPTILKRASGFSTWIVTLLVVLPYLAGLAATLLNGWHSDRTQERRWHAALPLLMGGTFLLLAILFSSNIWMQLAFFTLFAACVHGYQPCFWALPTATLGESAAAASIGLINSLGNLGGFAGPFLLGFLATRTGSFISGLSWLVANLFLAGILVLCLRGVGRVATHRDQFASDIQPCVPDTNLPI